AVDLGGHHGAGGRLHAAAGGRDRHLLGLTRAHRSGVRPHSFVSAFAILCSETLPMAPSDGAKRLRRSSSCWKRTACHPSPGPLAGLPGPLAAAPGSTTAPSRAARPRSATSGRVARSLFDTAASDASVLSMS